MKVLTAYGEVDRSLVNRDRVLLNNTREKTVNLEYRFKQPFRLPNGHVVLPDEIVKRSAHVRLKEWPDGMEGRLADLLCRSLDQRPRVGRGITPSGAAPGDISKRALHFLARGVRFANVQALCTSFKMEILNGSHAFGTQGANSVRTVTTKDTFKIALFLVSASRGAADTVYNTTGELSATGNYSAGGVALTNATAPTTSGTTGFWTPSASAQWTAFTSSGSFDAAVIWNSASTSSLEVGVCTFGAQSITAGTFTLTMPTNDASNALVRIA